MTSRQKGLYLVAKLYELAAEFTDAELQEICNDQSRQPKSAAILHAIKGLIQLHREVEGSEVEVNGETHVTNLDRETSATGSAEASSLVELLSDRESFPTVATIAAVLSIDARPKESRDRYIARVSRIVGSMDTKNRTAFLKRIADSIKNTRPDSFISNWSKLIKEM